VSRGGGADLLDLSDSRRALLAEVEALSRTWEGGDSDDPDLRADCGRRLHLLRDRWREAPLLFGPELVARLRGLAEALMCSATPPSGPGRRRSSSR
jgi:ATP-dependent DNA helicase RecQ